VSDAWLRFSTPSSPTASRSLMKCPQCRTRMERVRSSARMHQVLSAIIAHAAVGRGSAVPQPLLIADRRAPNAVGRKPGRPAVVPIEPSWLAERQWRGSCSTS